VSLLAEVASLCRWLCLFRSPSLGASFIRTKGPKPEDIVRPVATIRFIPHLEIVLSDKDFG